MKNFTTTQKLALTGQHSYRHLLSIEFQNSEYYLTDADEVVQYDSQSWQPGFIIEIGEYEQNSTPSVDDTDFVLTTSDDTFRVLALSGGWLNRLCTLYRQTINAVGNVTATEQVFSGLLSDFKDSPEREQITFTASSVWADFEKVSGLVTNVKSQSRFDKTDLAFRHAATAIKSIPWGQPGADDPITDIEDSEIPEPGQELP